MLKKISPTIKISVILPVYNGEKYLLEAIQSVSSQNYSITEIIIIDDGSTDGTSQLIKQLDIAIPIRYFYQENKGPAFARNVGIKNATGEWLCFIDSDDIWPQNKIKSALTYLKNNSEVDVLWGMTKFFFESNELKSKYFRNEIAEKAIFNTYLGAAFFRKNVFEMVGNFDISLRFCEDLDWYLRAVEKKIRLVKTNNIDLLYRIHLNNSTHDNFSLNRNLIRMLRNKINRI
jgi:glycosyltransferase involved in cell wall biosynthesis